jgi:sugar O-acyltransferase (sialic acid O-acetyltransferase NeuD family)
MKPAVIIIGSGGHAAVVADALLAAGRQVLGCTDSDASRHGAQVCGLPVLGDDTVLAQHQPDKLELANGIGGTRGEPLRAKVQRGLESRGWQFTQVRHPSAIVSPFSQVAASAQLMARAVVQPGAVVGEGCIINTGAVVEHDAQLDAFVHLACGAVLCGQVQVGAHSHIGAAAVVRQGVTLGAHTVVGAGAAVLRSSAGGRTLVGVPATELGSST